VPTDGDSSSNADCDSDDMTSSNMRQRGNRSRLCVELLDPVGLFSLALR